MRPRARWPTCWPCASGFWQSFCRRRALARLAGRRFRFATGVVSALCVACCRRQWRLLHDLGGRLVRAQALERALAHQSLAGPAAKGDLRHQLRLDEPRAARDIPRHIGDRRGLARQRLELLRQIVEPPRRIAGADAARVTERVALAHRQQDRRERPPGLVRRPPADDDEFLLEAAFALEPASGAARAIGRIGALGDDALRGSSRRPAANASRAVADDMIGIDQRRLARCRASARSLVLAFDQRQARRSSPSRYSRSNR